ncbi:hypothetical protein D3C84_1067180 [compost metagenome]
MAVVSAAGLFDTVSKCPSSAFALVRIRCVMLKRKAVQFVIGAIKAIGGHIQQA